MFVRVSWLRLTWIVLPFSGEDIGFLEKRRIR